MEGRSTLRPTDLLVFGWTREKHACVDLKGVSPLVGLRENEFIAGQAARKAESKKVDKHAKACAENQHVFVLFAFDKFGSLARSYPIPDQSPTGHPQQLIKLRGWGFVFVRLGLIIQKWVQCSLLPVYLLY
ncbi:hypothetical protein HanRHA438_Chr05g0203111 [Helianthus annuus]|nr:hypothetical protein HanRHA438_Chr05g0203111 [Helianthus annuus]